MNFSKRPLLLLLLFSLSFFCKSWPLPWAINTGQLTTSAAAAAAAADLKTHPFLSFSAASGQQGVEFGGKG